jgi:hypothetical protein
MHWRKDDGRNAESLKLGSVWWFRGLHELPRQCPSEVELPKNICAPRVTLTELMGHANSRLTLDVYAQALTPAKRAAHLKVVEMIRATVETGSLSHAEEAESVSA